MSNRLLTRTYRKDDVVYLRGNTEEALRVFRVNQTTITLLDADGERFRVEFEDIGGYWSELGKEYVEDVAPSGLLWREPPTTKTTLRAGGLTTNPRYCEYAIDLRKHPFRWGQIAKFQDNRAAKAEINRIKQGKEGAFRFRDEFEIVLSQQAIYARYIGLSHDS